MKISEIMKTGTYIPAGFKINDTIYDAAYPFPLLSVDMNDERILISAPLHTDAFIAYPKKEEICIPFDQVKTIRCHAQKWYGGPLHKPYTDLFRFPIVVDIELLNHTTYKFRNNALIMIYDIYQLIQDKNIVFVDEKHLMKMLKKINTKQSALNIDIAVVEVLAPIAEQFELIA
ncbi:hypothetical protein [Absiella sp. AM29-15]|uniref:hypothetical protein n=1 Tax=Absiella sp. AM29-15 TaxID=2292278 RepID=UPI000E40FA49|nr:hypothetical protein [Absiella sp. AM29-15]RGC52596.1 hypothetical protein DW761_05855 [Absiella sp. AM29-15]